MSAPSSHKHKGRLLLLLHSIKRRRHTEQRTNRRGTSTLEIVVAGSFNFIGCHERSFIQWSKSRLHLNDIHHSLALLSFPQINTWVKIINFVFILSLVMEGRCYIVVTASEIRL